MLRTVASVFGAIMVVVGILGFFPMTAPDGMLFGIFHVNTLHNIVHILTGVIALACGLCKSCNICCKKEENGNRKPRGEYECGHAARRFFQVFGIVYGLLAILGFYYKNDYIMGVSNNMADTWLHVVISLFALYMGFIYKESVEK